MRLAVHEQLGGESVRALHFENVGLAVLRFRLPGVLEFSGSGVNQAPDMPSASRANSRRLVCQVLRTLLLNLLGVAWPPASLHRATSA